MKLKNTIIRKYKDIINEPVIGKFHRKIHTITLFNIVVTIVGFFYNINIISGLNLSHLLVIVGIMFQWFTINQMNKATKAREDFKKL